MLPQKSRSSHRRCPVKEGIQRPAQMFSCECYGIFKNTILKNISERPLLKISTSVTNLSKGGNSWYPFKPFSVLNFALTARFLCSMFCQDFLLLLFYNTHQVKYSSLINMCSYIYGLWLVHTFSRHRHVTQLM